MPARPRASETQSTCAGRQSYRGRDRALGVSHLLPIFPRLLSFPPSLLLAEQSNLRAHRAAAQSKRVRRSGRGCYVATQPLCLCVRVCRRLKAGSRVERVPANSMGLSRGDAARGCSVCKGTAHPLQSSLPPAPRPDEHVTPHPVCAGCRAQRCAHPHPIPSRPERPVRHAPRPHPRQRPRGMTPLSSGHRVVHAAYTRALVCRILTAVETREIQQGATSLPLLTSGTLQGHPGQRQALVRTVVREDFSVRVPISSGL